MRRIAFLVVALATLAGVIACMFPAFGQADKNSASVYLTQIPPEYRDWRLVSVAHEEGSLKDIRAILGDDATMTAYRQKKLPFPDGAIIARIAWNHVPSEENNKVFGDEQSFVPGPPTNIQFMVKNSKKYAATGGWGFGQFDNDGKPAAEAILKTCFPCHVKASRDIVFTRYAP